MPASAVQTELAWRLGELAGCITRDSTLLIVAKNDPYGFTPTKALFRAARSTDKQLLVVPGSSHGFFDSDASAAKVRIRILDFIKATPRC
jgi:pimeloyl-ACP methyl ester carboxylesterase